MAKTSTKPRDQDIARVAIGVFTVMFRGEQDPFYKPREGTIMHRAWKSGRLNFRQQRTWKKVMADFDGATGKSGKVTGSYQQTVQVSGNKTWGAYTSPEYQRVDQLCHRFLSKGERILLGDLVADEIKPTGVFNFEAIGLALNGFKNDDQARAAGVANVCALLNRIGDFYSY